MTKTDISTKIVTNEKNQAVIDVTVVKSRVATDQENSVKHLAQNVTVKGFRKGKAPLEMVKNQLDPQKITEHALNHLIPDLISTCTKEHALKIIGSPHLKIKDVKPDSDWVFEITFPLLPEIKLDTYEKEIKALNAVSKIVVPEKDNKNEDPAQKEEARLNKILDKLLETIKFDVPAILIDEEVNQALSRLLAQTEKLGIKIEDYLKNLNKKPEDLKADYEKSAENNLRLELILEAIAKKLALTVTDIEVEALVMASGDPKAKEKLDNPRERDYIKAILRKRKTIDALLNL